ncbi:hypothetical protein GCM10027346_08430 [Hymenobacter seoulensis]
MVKNEISPSTPILPIDKLITDFNWINNFRRLYLHKSDAHLTSQMRIFRNNLLNNNSNNNLIRGRKAIAP